MIEKDAKKKQMKDKGVINEYFKLFTMERATKSTL